MWFVLIKKKENHLTQKEKHMSNYLKKFLFSVLILMMPYMNSASNSMDSAEYDGSSIRTRKVSFVEEDRQDVLSFSKPSTTSKVVILEDSKVSWTSYLSSSVKSIFQGTYGIMEYTIRNPQKTMIIGLVLACQAVAAADCCCACSGGILFVEPFPNITECKRDCVELNQTMYECRPFDGFKCWGY